MKTKLDQIRQLTNERLFQELLTSLGWESSSEEESSSKKKYSQLEINLVHKTYRLVSESLIPGIARKEKEEEKQKEIEIYVKRSLFSAILLAELNIDVQAIVAAFLSDLVDPKSIENLVPPFNAPIISTLLNVMEVNKFELPLPWRIEHSYNDKLVEQRVHYTRKGIVHLIQKEYPRDQVWLDTFKRFIQMYISACKSLDVLMFKLVDRLPTIYLLEDLITARDQRELIARETLRIHALVAEATGFWEVKWALEDQSFRYLDPTNYRKIAKRLSDNRIQRERYINRVIHVLAAKFRELNLKATIQGRPKHIYSIYKKMEKFHTGFEKISDTLGIRVIVDSKGDCYGALDIIRHQLWPEIPDIYGQGESFRDWIDQRKLNQYQSLHVTVRSLEDKPLEVQIRTYDMDEVAKYGAAAHWRYKLTEKRIEPTHKREKDLIKKMGDLQRNVENYLRNSGGFEIHC